MQAPDTCRDLSPRAAGLGFCAVFAVAAALRLYRLGDVPLGFHPDEAHNALDALAIAGGWRPVFLPGNNGREPLFMYLMAVMFSAFGPSIWSARLTAAVAGLAMLPAQVLLVQALPLPRPRLTALLAAAVVAVTFWPMHQSRYAIEAVLLPPLMAVALWAWWHPIPASLAEQPSPRPRGVGWAALAGLVIGIALYAHLVARLMLVALAVSALWNAFRARSAWPVALWAVTCALAALVALPQLAYFRDHPEYLTHRSAIVSIFNPDVSPDPPAAALRTNALRLLQAPWVRGDSSWSHNQRRRPVFDPLLGIACLVGLGLLARDLVGRRGTVPQAAAVLLAAALAVTLVPSLFSVGAPNYTRLVGTWPVLFLLPAWGLEATARWLAALVPPAAAPAVGVSLVGGVLVVSLAWTVRNYFVSYADEPYVREAFLAPVTERGRAVAALAAAGPSYAMPALWNQSVVRFLATGRPVRSFDPRSGLVLAPEGTAPGGTAPRTAYLFDPAEEDAAAAFAARWRAGREERTDSRGQPSLSVLRLAGDPIPASARPIGARFGGGIMLDRAAVTPEQVHPGGTVTVTLVWRAVASAAPGLSFFIHLTTPDGRSVGQFDGPPLDGSYPADTWQSGERILQQVAIPIAADAPAALVTAQSGWYDWRTGERLPVAGDDDAAVVIGSVEILPPGP